MSAAPSSPDTPPSQRTTLAEKSTLSTQKTEPLPSPIVPKSGLSKSPRPQVASQTQRMAPTIILHSEAALEAIHISTTRFDGVRP